MEGNVIERRTSTVQAVRPAPTTTSAPTTPTSHQIFITPPTGDAVHRPPLEKMQEIEPIGDGALSPTDSKIQIKDRYEGRKEAHHIS